MCVDSVCYKFIILFNLLLCSRIALLLNLISFICHICSTELNILLLCIRSFLLENQMRVSTAVAAYSLRSSIMLQYPESMIVDVSRYHTLAIAMISLDDFPLMSRYSHYFTFETCWKEDKSLHYMHLNA